MARVRVQVPVDQTPVQHVPTETSNTQGLRQLLTRNNILIGLAVLLILVVIFTLLSERKKLEDKVNKLSTSQGSGSQSDTQKYITAVSKLAEVPVGVTPQVKVPTDQEITTLVKDNTLYNTAKTGDVFLIYTNQDKSLFLVIYRPSTGKLILAAPASTQATAKP